MVSHPGYSSHLCIDPDVCIVHLANSNELGWTKGTPIQPLCAAFNCMLWTTYGLFKKPAKDWPIILANIPGIILGIITFITSF